MCFALDVLTDKFTDMKTPLADYSFMQLLCIYTNVICPPTQLPSLAYMLISVHFHGFRPYHPMFPLALLNILKLRNSNVPIHTCLLIMDEFATRGVQLYLLIVFVLDFAA